MIPKGGIPVQDIKNRSDNRLTSDQMIDNEVIAAIVQDRADKNKGASTDLLKVIISREISNHIIGQIQLSPFTKARIIALEKLRHNLWEARADPATGDGRVKYKNYIQLRNSVFNLQKVFGKDAKKDEDYFLKKEIGSLLKELPEITRAGGGKKGTPIVEEMDGLIQQVHNTFHMGVKKLFETGNVSGERGRFEYLNTHKGALEHAMKLVPNRDVHLP
jgi:hypothetical protein